jgi:hypothetical protein
MDKPESFEQTDYGEARGEYDRLAVINQIVADKTRESSARGVMVSFAGNTVTLKYSAYEMHLPTRMRQVEELAQDVLKEMLSHLKKEFRKRTRQALSLKEIKDRANYAVQKVSLNERYMYSCWRVYELS